MKRAPRLIAFLNAYTRGKSGGDVVFLEKVKFISKYDLSIVTSSAGKQMCKTEGIHATYFITSSEQILRNTFLTYLKRTLRAIFIHTTLEVGDIIVSSSDSFTDIFPALFLKLKYPKAKWITHVFHIVPSQRFVSHILQRISLWFMRFFSDKVIVDNELLKSELTGLNFDVKKIIVEYPTINFSGLQLVNVNRKERYDGIFMGQIRKSKGISELIDIWKLVAEKIPTATLGIIGTGDEKHVKELKLQVKKTALEKQITFLGFLDDTTAFSVIKASKIFVFPSFEEGFGIAAHQAQALGVPVVGWNLTVFRELFAKGMITSPTGDNSKFCASVVRLLKNDTMRQKLGKNAIENARQFNKKNEYFDY
jgi:glycosyltransferase involved in cell wall biosynthesis